MREHSPIESCLTCRHYAHNGCNAGMPGWPSMSMETCEAFYNIKRVGTHKKPPEVERPMIARHGDFTRIR